MPSSPVSSHLLPFHEVPFVAKVIGADATATSYVLSCGKEGKVTDCGVGNYTITVGSWAAKTLPSGAAETGEFYMYLSMGSSDDDLLELSFHCDMTRSVAEKCTTTNIGGNNGGTPVATWTDPKYLSAYGYDTFSWSLVTITAGQELLAATHTASTEATATGDAPGDATATGSSVTPSAVKNSSAASCLARFFTAMSVAGVTMSIVLS